MAFKIILDANIILDLSLQRTSDFDDLKKIYAAIVSGTFRCYTTTSIIHICGYWLTKAVGSINAKKVILSMLNDINVIDASHNTVLEALHSNMTDIEDALQYYVAFQHKLDFFISRDEKFIRTARPEIPVYQPSAFIKKFIN